MKDDIFSINPGVPDFLFDVDICEMDLNTGRKCKVKKKFRWISWHEEVCTVARVQKDYDGNLCYRLVAASDEERWGFPMKAEAIEFID